MRYPSLKFTSISILTALVLASASLYLISFKVVTAQTSTVWYVDAGGQLAGYHSHGFGFYPSVIVIDAGDTVTWTIRGRDPHTITFLSGNPPPPPGSPSSLAPIPCSSYDGKEICSSGIIFPGAQYSLTFTVPGVYIYMCLLHPGMQGVVVVQPQGAPYPHTQQDYNVIAFKQLVLDTSVGEETVSTYSPYVTPGPNNSKIYHVAAGISNPVVASTQLKPVSGQVNASISLVSAGPMKLSAFLKIKGIPNTVYQAQILYGSSQFGQASGYKPINLTSVTTDSNGNGNSTTVINGYLVIPSAGWFVNVYTQSTSMNNLVATGDIKASRSSNMGFTPDVITINAGDYVEWTVLDTVNPHTISFVPPNMKPPEFGEPLFFKQVGNNTEYTNTFLNSGLLTFGNKYILRFNTPGEYSYLCLLHDSAGMFGYITVLPRISNNTLSQVTTISQTFTNAMSTTVQVQNTTPLTQTSTSDDTARAIAIAAVILAIISTLVSIALRRR
jgi:plastocyanin